MRLPNGQVVNEIPMFHGRNLSVVSVLPKGGLLGTACLDHHPMSVYPEEVAVLTCEISMMHC